MAGRGDGWDRGVGARVEGAAREAAPWVKPAARLGYAAKGVVYVVIGLLAARAAMGRGGGPGDSRDALATMIDQPLGRALVGVVAVGLFGYALWRLLCGVADTEGKGTDAKGIALRIGYVGRAILHGVLGWEALRLAMRGGGGSGQSGGGGGGGEQAEHWTARVLELPWGQWLVGIGAAALAAWALYQLYVAASDKVARHLDLGGLDAGSARWAVRAGRIGVAARGVVAGVIAWLLLRAAMAASAQEAGGVQEALGVLWRQGSGQWLLGGVGLGLLAYGLFQFVNARYRRIEV